MKRKPIKKYNYDKDFTYTNVLRGKRKTQKPKEIDIAYMREIMKKYLFFNLSIACVVYCMAIIQFIDCLPQQKL